MLSWRTASNKERGEYITYLKTHTEGGPGINQIGKALEVEGWALSPGVAQYPHSKKHKEV